MINFAALALAALASAGANTPPPDMPLGAFPDYGHPEIGADNCEVKSPGHAECFIPAKSAGRYVVVAAGTATATGDGPVEAISVGGPSWICGKSQTRPDTWTSGPQTLIAQCTLTVLNDQELPVVIDFAANNAKLDPKGPKVSIVRIPWNGVLSVQYDSAAQQPKPAEHGGGDK